jgi:hypothetical protein
MGDETSFTTSKRFGSRENSNVATRPTLSVTFTNPVAVTLVSFTGTESKSGILLNWETVAEYNNAFFIIEHSIDGTTFNSIGKVNGAGTSSLHHFYQFTHQGILEGQHYYRLVQTDMNGLTHYSNVLSILVKNMHLQLSITPNPVANVINIGFTGILTGTSFMIINSSGIPVKSGTLPGNQLVVDGIPAGFYMLRLFRSDNEILSGLFIKQ